MLWPCGRLVRLDRFGLDVAENVNAFSIIRRAATVFALGLLTLATPATPGTLAQSKLWEFQANGEIGTTAAVGVDGTVYFGASDGNLYALSSTGAKRWQFAADGAVTSSPALGAGDTVYFGSTDRRLYAVSPAGVALWTFGTGGEIRCSPAIGVDGTVYVGSLDGTLYAIGPGGLERWKFATRGQVFASPAIGSDGTIYAASRDGRLYALTPAGDAKWVFAANGQIEASPAIGLNGAVIFGSLEKRIYALSPGGTKLWEVATDSGFYSSPAVGLDGTVYVAAYSGTVYALKSDGTLFWKTTLPARVGYSSIALAADGTTYVGAQDGSLYALTASGGIKWTFNTGSSINSSSPTIRVEGSIFIGAKDGRLYAVAANSPPAPGAWPMFGRDQRHTAGGFVDRQLPSAYSGGLAMTVVLAATPGTSAGFYTVEDYPPGGWTVGELSDSGYYDATSRRVRFGPFLDGVSRQLSYTVTPPLNESGPKTFVGSSAANGVERLLGGAHVLKLSPLHPADNHDVDGWMTIGEMAAYGVAWKRGSTWPTSPSPVPTSYLLRAVELWSRGEAYHYDANYPLAPQWWFHGASDYPGRPRPQPLQPGTSAPNGMALASLPLVYKPGAPFGVAIDVRPSSNVLVQAFEHQPPQGWSVSNISDGGFLDAGVCKVKWGPYFDAKPRTLSYQITPPASATNAAAFAGVAAFDASLAEISGASIVQPADGTLSDLFAWRHLPPWYAGGARLTVTIATAEIKGHVFYTVSDTPPQGWTVGPISHGGYYDASSRTVRFGPFYDGEARVLSYDLTAPVGETGTKLFAGTFSIDAIPGLVTGDVAIDDQQLHPADRFPVDAWLTINEMTAYGAAWKRGTNWLSGPAPVPLDFAARAVALWQSGEAYTCNTNFGSAPRCWTPIPVGTEPVYARPAPVAPETTSPLGTAQAMMPEITLPDDTVTISMTVTPATNVAVYAVEEMPPADWHVAGADVGGFVDLARGTVKWGPFFDSQPRHLSYQIKVPPAADGVFTFAGQASFDGSVAGVSGQRKLMVSSGVSPVTFVTRELPPVYSPGLALLVSLRATPPVGLGYYIVEDTPPSNWQVTNPDNGGFFDAAARKVRFGPFFDDQQRTLTYAVTAPSGETGTRLFTGTSTADDIPGVIGGDYSIDAAPLHPADVQPADRWLTIAEAVSYAAVWKRGGTWPAAPMPISSSFMARSISLWLGGEYYQYEPAITNPPACWVNPPTIPVPDAPASVAAGATATNGNATATVPRYFVPGDTVPIRYDVTPATNVLVYALEDQPPRGWTVSRINEGGFYDQALGKVKWGPFFDSTPRVLTYELLAPVNAEPAAQFSGAVAFDSSIAAIRGRRQTFRADAPVAPRFSEVSALENGTLITLQGFAGEVYLIETSNELQQWRSLLTLTITNLAGTATFLDKATTNLPSRFYRAIWP